MSKKYIALLPLKGHSERVPGKNLRLCAGKPLFHWVLETLLGSSMVSQVIVNTDSLEIRRSCEQFPRVTIHERKKELCGDLISMNDIIRDDIAHTDGEYYLQTHATNPLITGATIAKAIRELEKKQNQYDSLFTVTHLQTRLYDHNFAPLNHDPEKLIRTQDLDPIYEENSNLYLFSRASFTASGRRIGNAPCLFPMDKHEALDIDTETDFQVAEAILSYRREARTA